MHRNCCGLKLNLAAVDCGVVVPVLGFMSIFVGTSEILLAVAVDDVVVVDAPLLTAIGVAKIILVVVLAALLVAVVVILLSSGTGDEAGDDLIFSICGISSSLATDEAPIAAVFDLIVAPLAPFSAELLVNCK